MIISNFADCIGPTQKGTELRMIRITQYMVYASVWHGTCGLRAASSSVSYADSHQNHAKASLV